MHQTRKFDPREARTIPVQPDHKGNREEGREKEKPELWASVMGELQSIWPRLIKNCCAYTRGFPRGSRIKCDCRRCILKCCRCTVQVYREPARKLITPGDSSAGLFARSRAMGWKRALSFFRPPPPVLVPPEENYRKGKCCWFMDGFVSLWRGENAFSNVIRRADCSCVSLLGYSFGEKWIIAGVMWLNVFDCIDAGIRMQ